MMRDLLREWRYLAFGVAMIVLSAIGLSFDVGGAVQEYRCPHLGSMSENGGENVVHESTCCLQSGTSGQIYRRGTLARLAALPSNRFINAVDAAIDSPPHRPISPAALPRAPHGLVTR